MSGLRPKRPATAGPRRPADALTAPLGWGDELREQAAAVNAVSKPAAGKGAQPTSIGPLVF